VVGPTARAFSYNAAGNITGDGLRSYTYDTRQRLVAVSQAGQTHSYTINGLGERVKKAGPLVATGARHFVYDDQGRLLGEYDASGNAVTEYVYAADTLVGLFRGTEFYAVHFDHLNTPRWVKKATLPYQTVWHWPLTPFGDNLPEENPSGLGNFEFNLRFAGQYFDKETNLHYNYFRDYDPSIGRYIQSDPIGLVGGINTYAYVNGNPLSFSDSLGLFTITLGGNVRLPSWLIRQFFPNFQGQGFQFGIAAQLTKGGQFCPDVGAYWGGAGGGGDFGTGRGTVQLGFYGDGISDLAGPGFGAGFNYGIGGGSYSFDSQGNYQGFSLNVGHGYHFDLSGTAGQSWSIRGGYNSGGSR